jgi:hypothetical protein
MKVGLHLSVVDRPLHSAIVLTAVTVCSIIGLVC